MERVRVIPKVAVVRDPDNGLRPLPLEGAEVVLSSYWRRREADGDVEIVTLEPAAAALEPEE